MPYFDDAQAVYDGPGRLLQEAVADEAFGLRMQSVDAIVQFRLRNPDSQVTLGLLAEGERGALLGPIELQADLVVGMEADTAQELFSGELNPTVALAKGKILAKGPVAKVLRLLPLLGPLAERYKAQMEAGPLVAAAPEGEVAEGDAAEGDAPVEDGEVGADSGGTEETGADAPAPAPAPADEPTPAEA